MKVQQMYNKHNKHKAPIAKDKKILNRICKECGRYRKIPQHFCNDCWKETNAIINSVYNKNNNLIKGEHNE